MVIVAIVVMAPVRQNWGFAKVPVTFANCVSRKFVPWLYLTGVKVQIIIAFFNTQVVIEGLSSPMILFLLQVLSLNLVQI